MVGSFSLHHHWLNQGDRKPGLSGFDAKAVPCLSFNHLGVTSEGLDDIDVVTRKGAELATGEGAVALIEPLLDLVVLEA